MRLSIAVLLAALSFVGGLFPSQLCAHMHHGMEHSPDTAHHDHIIESTVDTAAGPTSGVLPTTKTREQPEPYQLHVDKVLMEHVHNKIVHFPIAFSLAALLFTILGFKRLGFEMAVRVLVPTAAAIAVVAYFTGDAQSSAFLKDPKEWVLNIHRLMGIISISLLWVWVLFLFWRPLRKFAWIIGLITNMFILITGFYGGILGHG